MNTAMLEYLGYPAVGTIAMLHATGFCKETWGPVVEELRELGVRHSVVVWDQPGHGETPLAGDEVDWWAGARETVEALGGRPGPIIGVGHSSGGAVVAMAEMLKPGLFQQMILLEPIIPPPPHEPMEGGLVEMTLKRRDRFDSPQAAADGWRGRGAFAGWEERALDAYVAGALRFDGEAWVLRCKPEIEAEYYRTAGLHEAWDRLGELDPPIHLVAAQNSNTHTVEFLAAQAAQIRVVTTEILPDVGHLFPMQDPALAAAIVARRIGETAPDRRT